VLCFPQLHSGVQVVQCNLIFVHYGFLAISGVQVVQSDLICVHYGYGPLTIELLSGAYLSHSMQCSYEMHTLKVRKIIK